MSGYEATIELTADAAADQPGRLVVEFPGARSGGVDRFTIDASTGGHLLHLAVAACVYNDLFREAAARGITLSTVKVTADGGFTNEPFTSTGIGYRITIEGDAPRDELSELVDHVVEIAEIPSALRAETNVHLLSAEISQSSLTS